MHIRRSYGITLILLAVGLLLFVIFGVNATKVGLSHVGNCSDIAGRYESCELHQIHYGFPFTYAEGREMIPKAYYTKEYTQPWALAANFFVWVLPLPVLYLTFAPTKNRR